VIIVTRVTMVAVVPVVTGDSNCCDSASGDKLATWWSWCQWRWWQ
jgi:hypothetical protein